MAVRLDGGGPVAQSGEEGGLGTLVVHARALDAGHHVEEVIGVLRARCKRGRRVMRGDEGVRGDEGARGEGRQPQCQCSCMYLSIKLKTRLDFSRSF